MKRMHHSTGAPRGLGFHPRRAVVIMRPTCWFLFKTLAESTYPAPVFLGWSPFERSGRIELHAPLFQMRLPTRQTLFRFLIQVAGHSCRPAFIGQGKNSEFPLEFTHMNKHAVSRPHLLRWLAPFPIESHPAAFDCLGGEGPGLEEPGGPQPFIYANLFHNPIDLPDSSHHAVSPLRAPGPRCSAPAVSPLAPQPFIYTSFFHIPIDLPAAKEPRRSISSSSRASRLSFMFGFLE